MGVLFFAHWNTNFNIFHAIVNRLQLNCPFLSHCDKDEFRAQAM